MALIHKVLWWISTFDGEVILQMMVELPFYLSALIVQYSVHINAMC